MLEFEAPKSLLVKVIQIQLCLIGGVTPTFKWTAPMSFPPSPPPVWTPPVPLSFCVVLQIRRLEQVGREHPSLAATLDTAWVRLGVMPVFPGETTTVPLAPPPHMADPLTGELYDATALAAEPHVGAEGGTAVV